MRYKNYKIEKDFGETYSLYKDIISKKKETEEEYITTKVIGYNMSFEKCLKRIVFEETEDKETIGLYIREYNKVFNELKSEFKKWDTTEVSLEQVK